MTNGVKLLIIEDNNGIRDLLVFFLNFAHERGIVQEYEICSSAEKAWERIAAQDGDLDIVFTDIHMPGMSGLELIKKVKTSFPKIKCIATSAFDYTEEAMSVGAETFFRKPYDPAELMKKIQDVEGGR